MKNKMYFYSESSGLLEATYDKEDNGYKFKASVNITPQSTLSSTKEDAILKFFFTKMSSIDKEENNLKKRLDILEKQKSNLRTKLDIDNLKNKYPEKFIV